MTRSGPLVMMMLDSLADAYVQRGDAPFYSSLVPRGTYVSLESLFAFEGIMAAVLTGRWPDETGVFARFAYGPDRSVMRHNPLRALNLIDRHAYNANGARRDGRQNAIPVKAVRKVLQKFWYSGGGFNNLGPYGGVPLGLAHKFCYGMTLGAYDRTMELAGHETLFGKARRLGLKGYFHYGELPEARAYLERIPDLQDAGVILIHTWTRLDLSGHEHGPESDFIREMTRDCDSHLRDFLNWLEPRLPDASYVLFADHGMHSVDTVTDVTDVVEDAIDGTGPLVFVDSTAVRAWGEQDQLEALAEKLSAFPQARVLGEPELRKRHTWFDDFSYGQLFVAADPGSIFVPDFFEGWKNRKGMHGYFQDTPWLRPSMLWYGPAFQAGDVEFTPDNMTDVFRVADFALDRIASGGTAHG